jgi:cobalt/nickel transport system permease protein
MSVLLAALACTVELALSGAASFTAAAPAMLGLHAGIGVGEALLTVALVILPACAASTTIKSRLAVPALLLAAVVAAPFVCPWPDGLESAALRVGFDEGSASTAPLADYMVPAIRQAWLSTWVAATIGMTLVFLCALPLARTWQRHGNA